MGWAQNQEVIWVVRLLFLRFGKLFAVPVTKVSCSELDTFCLLMHEIIILYRI